MNKTLILMAGLLLTASCTNCNSTGPGEPEPSSPEPEPPAPVLPPELEAQLERTPDDRPILIKTGAGIGDGAELALVFDDSIDDPVRRWNWCMAEVNRCYAESASTPCMSSVVRCSTDEGGEGCCPPACVDAFDQMIAGGADEDAAVDETFLKGDCVEGLTAQITAAGM